MQNVNIDLFKNAVAFTLSMRKFNNRRQGDMKKVETDADKNRLKLSKQLIDSPELEKVVQYQAELYQWITRRCVPSFFKDGLYLVKLTEVENFETKLKEGREEIKRLVLDLVKSYPAQIELSRIVLNGQFDIRDYPNPEELPAKFGIDWNWIAFGVPDSLPEELKQAEALKIEKKFQEAESQIMDALREGFATIVSHVTDRLSEDGTGKPKIFRNSLFDELTEFINTFNARNLVNDSGLEEVVKQANAILAKVRGNESGDKAETVRKSEDLRARTAEQFANLKARVEQIIIEKPSRKFDLE